MKVSVSRTDDPDHGPLTTVGPPGEAAVGDAVLGHRVHLGSRVCLDVDLTSACYWRELSFPAPSGDAGPLLSRLVGERAAVAVPDDGSSGRTAPRRTVAVDIGDAACWMRVAVVDALDRWLQLPLDQSLVDAERGVSRLRAAIGLAPGPVRDGVVAEALTLARQASRGVVAHLDGLERNGVVALPLRRALRDLASGYREAAGELDPGEYDDELAAVPDGWRRLTGRLTGGSGPRRLAGPAPVFAGAPAGPGRSTIDPRQSRARTFALAADPAATEVEILHGDGDGNGVRVLAPAFGARMPADTLSRLMARLVDRRTGDLGGHALLFPADRLALPGGPALLEASVPLCGLDPARVRADLFDVLVERTPAGDDGDAALRGARRAVVVLSRWRRILGLARMPVRAAELAPLVRDCVRGMRVDDPDAPLCTGAPSFRRLREMTELDPEKLLAGLCAHGSHTTGSEHAVARLTVAELAAADACLAG